MRPIAKLTTKANAADQATVSRKRCTLDRHRWNRRSAWNRPAGASAIPVSIMQSGLEFGLQGFTTLIRLPARLQPQRTRTFLRFDKSPATKAARVHKQTGKISYVYVCKVSGFRNSLSGGYHRTSTSAAVPAPEHQAATLRR